MREMINLIQGSKADTSSTVSSEVTTLTRSANNDQIDLDELFKLYDKHTRHMEFCKEYGLLTEEKKKEIGNNINSVYEMILTYSSNKRPRDNNHQDQFMSNNSVS